MKQAHIINDPLTLAELVDWGAVAHPIGEPVSRQSGKLLFRNDDGSSEMGVWQCSPGRWRCEVERDEFCYFLSGYCRYTSHDGTEIEIVPGTTAAFPRGWKGTCSVTETVRKVYMIC